jgi:hypothetical protein
VLCAALLGLVAKPGLPFDLGRSALMLGPNSFSSYRDRGRLRQDSEVEPPPGGVPARLRPLGLSSVKGLQREAPRGWGAERSASTWRRSGLDQIRCNEFPHLHSNDLAVVVRYAVARWRTREPRGRRKVHIAHAGERDRLSVKPPAAARSTSASSATWAFTRIVQSTLRAEALVFSRIALAKTTY